MNVKPTTLDLEPLIGVSDLAEYLGIPVATIYDWRSGGTGPIGYRIGKHVKYAVSDVREWLETQRDQRPAAAATSRGVG